MRLQSYRRSVADLLHGCAIRHDSSRRYDLGCNRFSNVRRWEHALWHKRKNTWPLGKNLATTGVETFGDALRSTAGTFEMLLAIMRVSIRV